MAAFKLIHLTHNIGKEIIANNAFDVKVFDPEQLKNYLNTTVTLCNRSFNPEISLKVKKNVVMKPMIKKDCDPDILNSYRLSPNASFLPNAMEYAYLQRLLKHLNNFDYLSQHQSAFTQFHSADTALCRVNNDLRCKIAEGKCSILVF